MNAMNTHIRLGLGTALGALFELADRRCTVLSAQLGSGEPRLLIESPPQGCDLRDASTWAVAFVNGQSPVRLHTVRRWGCRIEWTADVPEVRRAG